MRRALAPRLVSGKASFAASRHRSNVSSAFTNCSPISNFAAPKQTVEHITASTLRRFSSDQARVPPSDQILPPSEPQILATPAKVAAVSGDVTEKRDHPAMKLLKDYMSLTKAKLATHVALTTGAGYLLAPGAFVPLTFAATMLGTSLAIASANSLNQYIESESDRMMARTRKRPLPSGSLSHAHVLTFGVATGAVGSAILLLAVNPISSALAFSNIVLYVLAYTPLKKLHWTNTWVGGVVGAIPPVIGWVARTGAVDPGAWALGYVLFMWQIPHFLTLSFPLQHDYKRAGYQMLVNANPQKCYDLSLRYGLYHLPIPLICVLTGITSSFFLVTGTILNIWYIYQLYKFRKEPNVQTARRAFMASITYLPLILCLLVIHKASLVDDDAEETVEDAMLSAVIDDESELHSTSGLASSSEETGGSSQAHVLEPEK